MKISVIGTGYVGLVSGTCFAQMGNKVTCVDIDERKIEKLKQGVIPIYEPGLEEMVLENHKKGTLSFTTDVKNAIAESLITFIAVGTPMGEDGSADLQYVLAVAKDIATYMQDFKIIVDKSTVPVGTADLVKAEIEKILQKRKAKIEFDVVSNPEFLKEKGLPVPGWLDRRGRWACLATGAALPLGFAPFGWFWLVPLLLVGLLVCWHAQLPREAAWRGFCFGASAGHPRHMPKTGYTLSGKRSSSSSSAILFLIAPM